MLETIESSQLQDSSVKTVDPTYAYALAHCSHLGERTAFKVHQYFPTAESWKNRDANQKRSCLKRLGVRDVENLVTTNWDLLLEQAHGELQQHAEQEIAAIAYDAGGYPEALRQIEDPPLVLFIKGSARCLTKRPCVAIIGTRDTTPLGETVALRISSFFANKGFTVVSGLAKGIDTAAHRGAVEAHAPTAAVFATPLNKVYPAENKALARQILEEGGAWIGEIPLTKKTHRNAFVQRDRLQSGLSAAVVPVQTDVEGGTMHTVRFAEKQGRLLFCPTPMESERHLKQYAGVSALLQAGRAAPFQSRDYDRVLEVIRDHLCDLVDAKRISGKADRASSPQDLLCFAPEPAATSPELRIDSAVKRMARVLLDEQLATTEAGFDEIVGRLRALVIAG